MKRLVLLIVLLAAVARSAGGAEFVVSSSEDSGENTLRSALLLSNERPGRDAIVFRCPADADLLIRPIEPLPPITDPVVIQGACGILDGTEAGDADGLEVLARSTIRALRIRNFAEIGRAGVALLDHTGSVLEGLTLTANGYGIRIEGGGRHEVVQTLVGGAAAGAGNLCGGIVSQASSLNTLGKPPCLILCPEPGGVIQVVGNGGAGIVIGGNLNRIEGEVIANAGDGIRISGDGNQIRANVVGNGGVGIFELGINDFVAGRIEENVVGPWQSLDFGPALDVTVARSFVYPGSTTRRSFQFRGVLQGVPGRFYRLDFWAADSCSAGGTSRTRMNASRFLETGLDGRAEFDVTVSTETFAQTPSVVISAGPTFDDPSGLRFALADSFGAAVCATPAEGPVPTSLDLELTMVAPSSARAGEPFAVPITIRNPSPSPSPRIELRLEALPNGRILAIDLPGEYYLAAGQGTATIEIPAETTIHAVAVVNFPSSGQGTITASANLLQGVTETDPSDNTRQASVAVGGPPSGPPSVRSTLRPLPPPAEAPLARRYAITVQNFGAANAGPVFIPLPGSNLDIIALSLAGARCDLAACIIPVLEPGERLEGVVLAVAPETTRRRLVRR